MLFEDVYVAIIIDVSSFYVSFLFFVFFSLFSHARMHVCWNQHLKIERYDRMNASERVHTISK